MDTKSLVSQSQFDPFGHLESQEDAAQLNLCIHTEDDPVEVHQTEPPTVFPLSS